jgi:hypothetical protein
VSSFLAVVLRFVAMTDAIASLSAKDQGKFSAALIAQGNFAKGSTGQKQARRDVSAAGQGGTVIEDDDDTGTTYESGLFALLVFSKYGISSTWCCILCELRSVS